MIDGKPRYSLNESRFDSLVNIRLVFLPLEIKLEWRPSSRNHMQNAFRYGSNKNKM